jgi:thiosulfate reductase cytochrome b subunit
MGHSAQPLMIINTIMTEKDYRKFLYLITFRKNKYATPLLGLLTAALSLPISFEYGYFIATRFVFGWLFLFMIAAGVLVIKVEMRFRQRLRTDRTGTFGRTNRFKFYEDKIALESDLPRSTGELSNEQFYAVLESKEYFMLYLTSAQALLIRKEDLVEPERFEEFITAKFAGRYRRI